MKTKYLLFSLLLAIAPLFVSAQSWQEVGVGGFSNGEASLQKVAVDGVTPYVAYSDYSNDHKITVKMFNGSSWETVGVEGFGEPLSDLDFAIANGNFYIAYSNGSGISVMKLIGGQWVYEGASPIANGNEVNLTIVDDIPFIAYCDSDFAYKVSAKKFTTSGWVNLGEPGFTTAGLSSVIDIEVDGEVAYVAYRDSDNDYKASVMRFENGIWSVIGNEGFSGGTHDTYNSLAIYNNEPYVASWNSDAQGAVYKFDGTTWQQVGSAISTGVGRSVYLRTSTLNELHVTYRDPGESNKVFVKKLVGSSWVTVGDAVSILSASYVSMAFNTNGKPYIAYQDDWYVRRTTVMTYDETTGVDNELDSSTIQIYPNPAENHLQILNTGSNPIESFAIYDQIGRLIREHNSAILAGTRSSYDISAVPPGVYHIQMRTGNGIITYKFIKH